MMTSKFDELQVVVAVLTRRRPEMLARCLNSIAQTQRPKHTKINVVVVENEDAQAAASFSVDDQDYFAPGEISVIRETRIGIPFGRNAAAKWAVGEGADLLVFVDDDETVAEDWLKRLVDGYRQSGAYLMGGPVRVSPPSDELGWWEKKMHDCLTSRFKEREKHAQESSSLHGVTNLNIATNNWLADVRLFTEHGIWFDEKMAFTGFSDVALCERVAEAGLPIGWVKDAIVYEELPRDRLRVSYQFKRGRDQSNMMFRSKMRKSRWARYSVFLSVPSKVISIAFLAILFPLTKGATLHHLCRTSGWVAGRVAASLGIRSTHYVEVTGH